MSTPRLTVVVGRFGAEPPVGPYHHTIFSGPHVVEGPSTADWPFQRSVTPPDPARLPLAIVIPNLHRAFPAGQTSGTRLVLTQSTYQLQRWIDWLDAHPDVHVMGLMQAAAPSLSGEALARRGPWSRIELQDAEAGRDPYSPHGTRFHENSPLLAAFLQPDAQARLIASRQALEDAPDNAALHLAAAVTIYLTHRG